VAIFLKSGSLNLLEPLGPVQACNGIALPLPTAIDFKAAPFIPQMIHRFKTQNSVLLKLRDVIFL
jgi:hypothetical protein